MSSSSDTHILHAAKGVGFLGAGSLVGSGIGFVTSLLLARALGAEGMGMYALGLTAASLVSSLSALGLDDAMVRYLAIQRRADDDAGVTGTLQIGLGVSTMVGCAGGIGLFVLAGPVASTIFNDPELAPLMRAFGCIVPLMTLSNALVGTARGFKRMDISALGEDLVQTTVRLALIALLSFVGLQAVTAAIIFGVGDVASSVTMLVLLRRTTPLRAVFRPGARREFRGLFSFALPLWLVGALRKVRQNLEMLLLGTLTAVATVGIYTVAAKIGFLGYATYRAIIVSVKPNLAELHGVGDRAGLERLYRTATRWALLVNLPFFLVTALYADPLLRIFGNSFAAGSTALVILAIGELVNAGTGVCGSVLDMTRHTGAKLINAVTWLVVLVGLNLLLIPRWGLVGAATAAAVTTGLVNTMRIWQVWALERVQPYDRTFYKPLLAGSTAAAVGLAMRFRWPDPQTFSTVLQALSVVIIYAVVLTALRLAPEDRMVIRRVAARARRLRRTPPPAQRPADQVQPG